MNRVERPTERRAGPPVYLKAALLLLAVLALPGAAGAQWSTSGNNISNTNTGNVGVGTASPGAKLDVTSPNVTPSYTGNGQLVVRSTDAAAAGKGGTVELGGFYYNTSNYSMFAAMKGGYEGGTNAGYLSLFTEPNEGELTERVRVTSAGNVGVGTTSTNLVGYTEARTLTLSRGTSATSQGAIELQGGDGTGTTNHIGGINWFNGANRNAYIGAASDGAVNSGNIQFYTTNAGTIGERMRIDKSGNVGIGTTNLAHTLEVNGTINASQGITGQTINATYQDVAEWVPSTQKLAAGTVVVLDTARTNHVLASTKAYDTGVAGVVSDMPGVILGQGGADKVKVATTGRVKVRVDATRAPIHVGDLLVTGEVEGVAMKSVPVDLGGTPIHRPGTIIGKALEPLEKGTGEILVLLSLQ